MGSGILLNLGFEIPGDLAPAAQLVKKIRSAHISSLARRFVFLDNSHNDSNSCPDNISCVHRHVQITSHYASNKTANL